MLPPPLLGPRFHMRTIKLARNRLRQLRLLAGRPSERAPRPRLPLQRQALRYDFQVRKEHARLANSGGPVPGGNDAKSGARHVIRPIANGARPRPPRQQGQGQGCSALQDPRRPRFLRPQRSEGQCGMCCWRLAKRPAHAPPGPFPPGTGASSWQTRARVGPCGFPPLSPQTRGSRTPSSPPRWPPPPAFSPPMPPLPLPPCPRCLRALYLFAGPQHGNNIAYYVQEQRPRHQRSSLAPRQTALLRRKPRGLVRALGATVIAHSAPSAVHRPLQESRRRQRSAPSPRRPHTHPTRQAPRPLA